MVHLPHSFGPRRAVVIAVVSVLLAGVAAAAATTDPNSPTTAATGWSFNGAAQPIASGVQLTTTGHAPEAGSMFWNAPVTIDGPIRVGFAATMSGGGPAGADGIALVFADANQGASPHDVGESGLALGFGGIPGVEVTLDTYKNIGEPGYNFVGISNGLNANGTPNYLATSVKIPDLKTGTHKVRVTARPNHLDVSIDGCNVLSKDVALPALSYIGVTGANGAFTDDHIVTNLGATNADGVDLLSPQTSVAVTPSTPPTSTSTSTSTTTATGSTGSTENPQGTSGDSPPSSAGYFALLPPGSALPSDAQCAARVHLSSWEPRPENTTANNTTPPSPPDLAPFSQWNSTWNNTYRTRIDGNYTGTTDEIAQWAACKWGWSDNLVRAQMTQESNWRQSNQGDREPRSNGHCVFDNTSDPCPTSFSIIQVKWYFHPAGVPSTSPHSSYPWIKTSTAYALDLELTEMRGCYNGMSTYLGNTQGDLWGCIQTWYSGTWTPNGGAYAHSVNSILNAQPWLAWKG